jgi:hypothetical protein
MLVTKLPPILVSSYYSNPRLRFSTSRVLILKVTVKDRDSIVLKLVNLNQIIHLHPRIHKPRHLAELKDCPLLHSEHAPTPFSLISGIERMRFCAHFLNLNYPSGLVWMSSLNTQLKESKNTREPWTPFTTCTSVKVTLKSKIQRLHNAQLRLYNAGPKTKTILFSHWKLNSNYYLSTNISPKLK